MRFDGTFEERSIGDALKTDRGPAEEKPRSPNLVRMQGSINRCTLAERRPVRPLPTVVGVTMSARCDGHWQVCTAYISKHLVYLMWKSTGRQPVQLLQRLCDVVGWTKAEDQPCCSVLDVLKSRDCRLRQSR